MSMWQWKREKAKEYGEGYKLLNYSADGTKSGENNGKPIFEK